MRPLLILSGMLLGAAAICAEEKLSAGQIVEKANLAAYYGGKDGRAEVKMTITDAKGRKRIRAFVILRLNERAGGNQRFYVYFKAPADVRKMAYLVWKKTGKGKEDDRWMWLPALNLKRRIAPGDKRISFVGSHFLYEDVSGRSLKADRHELVETTEKHHVIKSTPLKAGTVEFAYYLTRIDRKTFLPVRAEYYNKNGKKYRLVEALKVETIQGVPTVMTAKATDIGSGSSTVNEFSKVRYNIGLKKRIFTERFLRRPPREVR